jgi:sigma-B regulation protein RsbU (phosphoserine phosphatase)
MEKPLRLLMVEDSDDDAQMIIRTLTKGGYDPLFQRVETAEAMRRALKEKSWDIIFSDYSLPQFSGLKAIAVWKETAPDLPLIILSGIIGEETAVECMRLGVQDYIMKGNLSRLVPVVERELFEAGERRQNKLTEQDLWESEERFRQVSQTIFGFVYSCLKRPDQPYVMDWITGAVESVTGYGPDEILNWGDWEKIVIEEDLPLFLDRVIGLSPGQVSVCDLRIRHKAGDLRWLKTYSKTVRDIKDSSLLRLYGACQDVTEHKNLEEKLLHRTDEITFLNTFIREVNSSLSLENIANFALKEIRRVVKPDLAFLFVREQERLKLVTVDPEEGRERLGPIPEHQVGE